MAGWGEAERSTHPVVSALGEAPSGSRPLALAALERLSPTELEQVYLGRMRDQGGSDEVLLPSRAQSASVARRLVLSVLQSWELHHQLEVGELLTGELVANAVQHAAGRTIGLQVQRRPGWLRVEVRDSSRALPCRIVAEPGGRSGRGLLLVEELSDRWGADLLPRGKGVWFELRVRERG